MPDGGFFEQRRSSPSSLATVVALHAAVLGALALVKGPEIAAPPGRLRIFDVPITPPEPEPPQSDVRPQPRTALLDRPVREIEIPDAGPVAEPGLPPVRDPGPIGEGVADSGPADPPPPVRTEAGLDPRYAGDLQPPYPASEQRAQRGGEVRIRVRIGPSGRVVAAERLSATSDVFWRATERQALSRWRFRPATLGGRPVESSKVMTVHFRIEDS